MGKRVFTVISARLTRIERLAGALPQAQDGEDRAPTGKERRRRGVRQVRMLRAVASEMGMGLTLSALLQLPERSICGNDQQALSHPHIRGGVRSRALPAAAESRADADSRAPAAHDPSITTGATVVLAPAKPCRLTRQGLRAARARNLRHRRATPEYMKTWRRFKKRIGV